LIGNAAEWKEKYIKAFNPPYSLGKLIDWKLLKLRKVELVNIAVSHSLLAREIN